MYLVKICKERQILDVLHYEKFENIVRDISNKSIFHNVSDDIYAEIEKNDRPKIYYGSETDIGDADDFEFRYENKIYVYAGKITIQD